MSQLEGTVSGGLGRLFDSLRERNFRLLWIGMLGSFMSMNMQMVARGYLAYDLSGSATVLGIVSLAWGFPQLLLSPVGGVVADRVSKRNLLIVTMLVMACTTFLNGILISAGLIEVWHLVALGLVQGAVFAFNMPARQALVPMTISRERLANAVAMNNSGMNLTRIVGPAIAGVLIAAPAIGTAGVFYTMGGAYLVSLVMLFQLPALAGSPRAGRGSMAQEILAGLRYIRDRPALRTLLMTAFAVVLLAMPYQTLLPLFALRVHDVGPEGLGMLNALAGLGALTGSLTIAYFSRSPRQHGMQLVAGIGFGVTLLVFALSPWYGMALVAMFFVGVTGNSYMALNNTLLMTTTEVAMHGRVMSVYMMTFALMPLSSLPGSMVADVVGAPLTIAGLGILTAIAVIALNARAVTALVARGRGRD